MRTAVLLRIIFVIFLVGFFAFGEVFRSNFIGNYVAATSAEREAKLTGMIIYGDVSEREVLEYLDAYTSLGEQLESGEITAEEFLDQSQHLERQLIAQDVNNNKALIDQSVAKNLTQAVEEQRKLYDQLAYEQESSPGSIFLLKQLLTT